MNIEVANLWLNFVQVLLLLGIFAYLGLCNLIK